MKKQLQLLERLNAPPELIFDFLTKCRTNQLLSPELQATTNELLEETCRKFGFQDILDDGWFFRPYRVSGEGYRKDTAVKGSEVEAPAIEQAYRRGFSQGFADCRRLIETKSSLNKIIAREDEIARWRSRNVQRFGSCPGDKEKPTRNLFGGRSTLSLSLRYAVLKRDGFKCNACGALPADGAVLEVDHIHPVSKGGGDNLENLQALCRECNAGKSNSA